jgi:lipopolysaccharide heptosyltransferase II
MKYMSTYLLKKLDAVVGRIVASVVPLPINNLFSPPITKLLLIRPGGIGDAVLMAPVIRALKMRYSSAYITVLAERRNFGVFVMIPGVDNLFCYDRPSDLFLAMRGSYDAVIDSEQWHRLSAVVARFVRAPIKIGFDTNERKRMFTHRIPYFHDDYETLSFNRLLVPLCFKPELIDTSTPFLVIPVDIAERGTEYLTHFCAQPFVALFPGASIPERRWGADRFHQVAEMLSAFGVRTVVVGGKEDRQQGDEIIDGGLGLNLAGQTSLAETAAVIQRSSLLLSGDSGVLHIAVGLDVPTVSLFGPGRSKKWAPRGERHIVINKELSCSPCTTFGTTPPCPIAARCMKEITVDEVVNAVSMLLISVGAMPSTCCKRDWIEVPKIS